MNVIEKLLTTRKYVHINAIKEIKKALIELSETEIDFSNINAAHEFKDTIDNTLRDILKNIPYDLNSKYGIGRLEMPNRWFDNNPINDGRIYITDTDMNWPRATRTSTNPRTHTHGSIDDLVYRARPNSGNSTFRVTSDISSYNADETSIQSFQIRDGELTVNGTIVSQDGSVINN